jgi:tetratricopeptide (TPR) repeat protein
MLSASANRRSVSLERTAAVAAREDLLGELGLAYAKLGDVEKAIAYHEQALTIAREISDRRGEGYALDNLGLAYAELGEVEKAIGYHEQALVIAREISNLYGEACALGNLGLALAKTGETEKASGYREQLLVVAREIVDRCSDSRGLNLGRALSVRALLDHADDIKRAIDNPSGTDLVSRRLEKLRGS